MPRVTVYLITLLSVLCLLQSDVSADVNVTQCPAKCECNDTSNSLNIDCKNRPGIVPEQLYEQLDSYLISYANASLASLYIQNSPLTHVPRSVCQLSTLTRLYLDHNRLTELPDNCFGHLRRLTQLYARYNIITNLQNGVFDGMTKLDTLNLLNNQISSIGIDVFSNKSNMTSLRYIDLSGSRLTTLEPWWYDVGLKASNSEKVKIHLDLNDISHFTNFMGWRFHCGMPPSYVVIFFDSNPINHISDMVKGWNLTTTDIFCLLASHSQHSIYSNVEMFFKYIYIICDCVDFLFFSIARYARKAGFFDNTYCRFTPQTPYDIAGVEVTRVPLDQFVCELTERCPSGCRCVHRPANASLHIDCSNSNLTVLPLELPELPKSYTKYKLDFSNNRLLRRLEHRDYFVNTSILNVSNSDIELIKNISNWRTILKINNVDIYGNKITSVPQAIVSVNISTAQLNIAKNPWDCSCDNKWMSGWLKSIAERLTAKVLCYNPPRLRGKSIIQTNEEEFCVDPAAEASKRAWIISVSSVAGVVVVLLSVIAIFYRLRVKLYTRWKFRPFDRDECPGEDMDYDVFLCCSSLDDEPIGSRILDSIEANGYRVCYHERDFMPGLIADNIEASVTRSKRTVCLLTSNFIQRFANVY